MLTLYGFSASNYYNKVKLALMEKGIAFEESLRWPDQTDGEVSPLHKVPYLVGEDGGMCESQVIIDYLEARYPQHPLIPADPFKAQLERHPPRHLLGIVRGEGKQHADAAHPVGRLRPGGECQNRAPATENCDESPTFHLRP